MSTTSSRTGASRAASVKAKEWAKTFDAVEKKFGVERWVLIALWGMETDYGAEKDHWDVFRSLATLAYVKYRHPYFRNELLVAMHIMQDGHIARARMVSLLGRRDGPDPVHAVEFRRLRHGFLRRRQYRHLEQCDRRARLHRQLPAPRKWKHGLPWGFEVDVPKGFDLMKSRASFAEWQKLGVRRADGKPFPPSGNGILFFPSGAKGPAFIATENFAVLKEYNNSDAYAIAVGHLADRVEGGPPIKAEWLADDRPLSRDARIALQKKLAALGHKVNDFEGHIDFDLRDNIRAEQNRLGLAPDGNPTVLLLDRLGVGMH